MTTAKLNVLVVGTGAVGAMACVALERSEKASVTAVLRSNYQQVKDHGFEIDSLDHGKLSEWRPSSIVSSVPQSDPSKPFDYIVVTTKNIPEVASVSDIVKSAVTESHTTIVLIQNGIGIEQPVINAFPSCVVLSGVSYIGADQINGKIIHDDHDRMIIGAFHNPSLDRALEKAKAEEFAAAYGATTPDVEVVDDINVSRWKKVMWNGIFNPMCAITQLNSASIRRYGGEYSLIRPAMKEMEAIARADGCELPDDIVDIQIETTPIELGFRPSMLQDVDKGNPMECEVILGNPLRIARKLGVETPVLDNTYRFLKLVQARLLEGKGYITPPKDLPKHDVFG